MTFKICTQCHQPLAATAEYFYRDNRRKEGLRPLCRKCRSQIAKQYNQTEGAKEKARKRSLRYYHQNPEKCCENCDYYEGAICHLWISDDKVCIEDIERPESQVCKEWEGD